MTRIRPAVKSPQIIDVQAGSFAKLQDLLNDHDPRRALQSGKLMAKAWAKDLSPDQQLDLARSFMQRVMAAYWSMVRSGGVRLPHLKDVPLLPLDESALAVATAIGRAGAQLPVIEAAFELGNIYTAILPQEFRSGKGIFYTPPALCERLLNLVEKCGVNFATARIADPACGGGAFLMPVALRMKKALDGMQPEEIIAHIERHLVGLEIDPFGAWMTQVFLEGALNELLAGRRLRSLVKVGDSLDIVIADDQKFDLVIGNPPYGKVTLTDKIRTRFKASLYGHANYYGMFTHLATDLIKADGIIGFLTPTSFLSGEYFKNLRSLLRSRCHPMVMDFVTVRKGVFEDVLQETMLTVFQQGRSINNFVKVNQAATLPENKLTVSPLGKYRLNADLSLPWVLPRDLAQQSLVQAMKGMGMNLSAYGYKVSTGPLVWNRHKEQLFIKPGRGLLPVIWAESVSRDGQFVYRTEKKNHVPWFKFLPGDESLLVNKPCLLLQRTTSKEQEKRLIVALLPAEMIAGGKAVVIENHLNMIIPLKEQISVRMEVLAALLNSKAVNDAFRTISGSVAVSAYELESLPLPDSHRLAVLADLVAAGAKQEDIEKECLQLYTL